jgi:hypothetical protein
MFACVQHPKNEKKTQLAQRNTRLPILGSETSILQKSPLGAEVVVEAGAGGHGLSVEVRGEGAVLHTMNTSEFRTCSY